MSSFKEFIRKILNSILPKSFDSLRSQISYLRYRKISFAQEGEDLILERAIGSKNQGFYVDVGAHHPIRFSNTYSFYKKGWRGINIDPMPKSMKLFNLFRGRDINLEIGVSATESIIDYYVFNEPALNGFSKELSEQRESKKYYVKQIIPIKTYPLKSILELNLPAGQKIDFLSIDVEGLDLEVLKSNDWQKYRPTFVLVEVLGRNLVSVIDNEVTKYLEGIGYRLESKLFNTCFFKDITSESSNKI